MISKNKIAKKLKSDKGETIVELLASILIASLSVALLFSCTSASVNINKKAKQSDKKLYDSITKVESRTTTSVKKTVVVTESIPIDITVNLYGEDSIYAYEMEETTSGG